MWFTRRSSQCCSGWESTLRTSQWAQNSQKRGNGWGWGSFFCSQRSSPADIDQVKTVLTCGAALSDSPPLFPSLVYFKITSQETWQLHVSESCPCHFHKFKSFVRAKLTAQKIQRGQKRHCRATEGKTFKERRQLMIIKWSWKHACFSVLQYCCSKKCNICMSADSTCNGRCVCSEKEALHIETFSCMGCTLIILSQTFSRLLNVFSEKN